MDAVDGGGESEGFEVRSLGLDATPSNRSRKRSRFSAPLVPGPFRGPWKPSSSLSTDGYHATMGDASTPPDAGPLIRWIMGAVLVWGTILGIGAWRLNNDPRRLLVVLACVIAFVGFWALMLSARARRRRRD